jgi:streptogramin lyase
MAFMAISFFAAGALARTYTTDADFDEGVLVGVEHETVHDQLQLSKTPVILPFIWVPNNNGTVSKVQTETGNELGRYQVAPHSGCSPSRTTVDLQGSCYVGNRQAGTVVKIGLYEAGIWIDRNGDGVCQTSQDLDHDGNITGLEILPWGQDECVLYEVVLIPGKEGTYTPGTYGGGYDYDYWGTAPRGLAVDAKNNLWAGTWATRKYYYIDGSTGAILKTVDVSPWGHNAYGAVIDRNGVLWSSGPSHTGSQADNILSINPSTEPPIISRLDMGHRVYGLGLDYLNHLFVAGWDYSCLSRVDVLTGIKDWTKPAPYTTRGVVCTADNDVWVTGSNYNKIYRYDNDGNYKAEIYVGNGPTGVAVDAAGKVWSCNVGDEYITRIDPTTNNLDLAKLIVGSGGHYTYSDMTGIISRTITTKLGTWTVVHDIGEVDTEWGKICWTSTEPQGTSIKVKVSSSDDQISWSPWETAGNAVPLSATPDGRFLKVEATLQILSGEKSPILYDLTIETAFIRVGIDIKPGSFPNSINPGSQGVIPVAILTTSIEAGEPVTFDASTVAPDTVRFGPAEAPAVQSALEDVDGDGDVDMILHFRTQETGIVAGMTEATLTGETIEGRNIVGTDSVRTVPPAGKK